MVSKKITADFFDRPTTLLLGSIIPVSIGALYNKDPNFALKYAAFATLAAFGIKVGKKVCDKLMPSLPALYTEQISAQQSIITINMDKYQYKNNPKDQKRFNTDRLLLGQKIAQNVEKVPFTQEVILTDEDGKFQQTLTIERRISQYYAYIDDRDTIYPNPDSVFLRTVNNNLTQKIFNPWLHHKGFSTKCSA